MRQTACILLWNCKILETLVITSNIPNVFKMKGLQLFTHSKRAGLLNYSSEQRLQRALQAHWLLLDIFAHTGSSSLFKTSRVICPVCLHLQRRYKKWDSWPQNSVKIQTSIIPTHRPPQCFEAQMKNPRAEQLVRIAKEPKGTREGKSVKRLSPAQDSNQLQRKGCSWML